MKITVTDINKEIKRRHILRHISATFETNQVTGIYGPNGTGKTMFLRVLSGLVRYHGQIYLDDQLQKGLPEYSRLGILIEGPGFINEFSGQRNLELIDDIASERHDPEDMQALFNHFDLAYGDPLPYRKYSLGMKQKLGLIQAFYHHPDVIFLDEPTNALDEEAKLALVKLIEARKSDTLFIITSHERPFLDQVTEQFYEMRQGTLIETEVHR